MQCESPIQPFCLCYPLFCCRGNEFWRFIANRWYLVGVRTMVVAARTKVGKENEWKNGSTDEESITNRVF
ncbi:hypothetical protein E2C01_031813 [Portunus trituberculatus]|uniref:Uncharacterized protein n=1 Tax=Portunus trituberculatus TaxID=210409 RepID=A0A5B7EYN7_PORTR|nr:hypothetical protein [Portunus trituberculatus]